MLGALILSGAPPARRGQGRMAADGQPPLAWAMQVAISLAHLSRPTITTTQGFD